MDKRLKERVMTIDNELGRNIRNSVLDDFEKTEKRMKRKALKEVNESDIFDRDLKEIFKLNNQEFLPLIYYVVFDINIDKNIHYKELNRDILDSLDSVTYEKLKETCTFIGSLSKIGYSYDEIYSYYLNNKGDLK